MTDLDKLIAAVESVTLSGEPEYQVLAESAVGEEWLSVAESYNGSLDAALRLHEALLPGWEATVAMTGHAGVMFWPTETAQNAKVNGQPARAWLLAILRALKAKGDA